MGEVYLADDLTLKRKVALKRVAPALRSDTARSNHIIKEAERASALNHPGIASIYDVFLHDGEIFLVMEYVAGVRLRDWSARSRPEQETLAIFERCAEALQAAHDQGIVHGDVKPDNVMITPGGQVKLLDFGVARRIPVTAEAATETTTGTTGWAGTPGYIAPEVLLDRLVDCRADLFSLGVMLYESLTGVHPFRGDTAAQTADRTLHEDPRPLTEIDAHFSGELAAMVEKLIAKDPDDRYASAGDFIRDIHAYRAGEPVSAPRARRKLPSAMRRWPVIAAAVVVIVFLAAGIALLRPRRPWSGTVSASSRQLVVLPFKPMDDEASSRAFADGLTEALAAKLGQIADRYPLEIVASSEVRAQKVLDAHQARAVLGATLVLEGSMQKSGSAVRVIYSIVDTKSLRQVHSGMITADASDPFAVEDRVMEQVLNSFDIELAGNDRGRMQAHGTTHAQAYEEYLRGRGYLQQYDRPESLDSAIAAFNRALAVDPKFALAYAGIGQAYLRRYNSARAPESLAAGKQACSRAVELDSSTPDGELCLGILFNAGGDYEAAASHLQKAVQIDPVRDETYRELAAAYEGLKRPADAESLLKHAIALRPQYWAGYNWLGGFYARHGRYQEAVAQFQRVVQLAPDSFRGYYNLGAVYVIQGKYSEAIVALERSIGIRPTGPALNNLGAAYFCLRRYEQAASTYQRAVEITPQLWTPFGNLAQAYAQIDGKQEQSRKAYAQALQLAQQQLAINPKNAAVLLSAGVYAAALGDAGTAEQYRKAGLKLSSGEPKIRLDSARVLALLHHDKDALAELQLAVAAGLPAAEFTIDPLWERFSVYPEYQSLAAKGRK
jgi:serine/threonine-protein kinase